MAKKKSDKKIEKMAKKDFRREVREKLSAALAVYKQELGTKKFDSRVRKASKIFAQDFERIQSKRTNESPMPKRTLQPVNPEVMPV